MQQDLKYYVTENSRKIYDTLFPIQQLPTAAQQQSHKHQNDFSPRFKYFIKFSRMIWQMQKNRKSAFCTPAAVAAQLASSLCF